MSLDELQEKVQEFEDYVQSSDIAAMQSKSHSYLRLVSSLIMLCRAVNYLYLPSRLNCGVLGCSAVVEVIACVTGNKKQTVLL